MREFLIKQTSPPFVVLWSLFIYWVVVMATHSAWSCGGCITKSFGVSAIVGTGLNASAFAGSQYDTLLGFVKGSPFTVMRFFLIPFCVASYSSIASVKKEDFTYLFPHDGPKPLTWTGVVGLILAAFITVATLSNYALRHTKGSVGPQAADIECSPVKPTESGISPSS